MRLTCVESKMRKTETIALIRLCVKLGVELSIEINEASPSPGMNRTDWMLTVVLVVARKIAAPQLDRAFVMKG